MLFLVIGDMVISLVAILEWYHECLIYGIIYYGLNDGDVLLSFASRMYFSIFI